MAQATAEEARRLQEAARKEAWKEAARWAVEVASARVADSSDTLTRIGRSFDIIAHKRQDAVEAALRHAAGFNVLALTVRVVNDLHHIF